MPEGHSATRLKGIIEDLGARFKSPLFEPHITLLGQAAGSKEEVLGKTAALAKSLTAFELNSNGLGFLDRYFQALFVKIKEAPGLMDANRIACQIFEREPALPYMPHLSLAYGDFDVREKERAIAGISDGTNFSFIADKIHLYATEGDPEDWHPIKSFPLSKV